MPISSALKMIEDNLATGEMTAEDMRAKATFLELDPRRVAILEAVDTMEKLVHSEELALPADRFTLARLYLHLKDLAKFREHMRVLLAKDPARTSTSSRPIFPPSGARGDSARRRSGWVRWSDLSPTRISRPTGRRPTCAAISPTRR